MSFQKFSKINEYPRRKMCELPQVKLRTDISTKLHQTPNIEKRKKADRKKNYKTDGKKRKNTDKVC